MRGDLDFEEDSSQSGISRDYKYEDAIGFCGRVPVVVIVAHHMHPGDVLKMHMQCNTA